MINHYLKVTLLVTLAFSACRGDSSSEKMRATRFELNADSSQIVLTGLGHSLIESLRADSLSNNDLAQLFVVVKQAGDEQLIGIEPPYPGSYELSDDRVVYTPDSGFVSGYRYRAELRLPEFYNPRDIVERKSLPGKPDIKSQVFEF